MVILPHNLKKKSLIIFLAVFCSSIASLSFPELSNSASADRIQADLITIDIKFYRPQGREKPEDEVIPQEGRLVTCKAVLKNQGNAPTRIFNVKWFLDDVQVGYGSHEALEAGQISNGNVRFDWTPTPGKHTLRFNADADNHVRESNETNNSFSKNVNISNVDNIPPEITITPVNSPTNKDVILNYIVTDNLTPKSEIIITGDNSPYTDDGSYNVILTARDKAGNSSTKSITFTIDKTPPVIIIDLPQSGTIFNSPDITLSGKIDDVPFTDNITLTKEGENILTKTAVDSAGNTNSISVTVYLYSGELVGPEGGEITSPDGKIRIIIPQGALNESKRINILTINRESLEDAVPNGKSLLSVVECRPYGVIFNKPVRIIYTLDSAEVPGTSMELGLYDAIQQQIVRTGDISTVESDSYSVSFLVMHFSTYAALKNLISEGAPIGSAVKIPLPDMLTGSFSHSIPIGISPGRKGIEPRLALVYRSSNPNSWIGLGFSLNPGYIVRSTRFGPPAYNDTQDTFYFNTEGGTVELVHLVDNLYQARIESSFTKFFKESDDSWKIIGKDGGILRFGQDQDAKEGSNQGTFSWYLTKSVDNNGNYIDYSYIKDQGKCYLSHIDYTGNEIGVSPKNSVEFILESRDDVSSSYMTTSRIATAKRLREIKVKVNSELVWRYELGYNYSHDTNRSLLTSIIQYGSDGESLPAQRLEYQIAGDR